MDRPCARRSQNSKHHDAHFLKVFPEKRKKKIQWAGPVRAVVNITVAWPMSHTNPCHVSIFMPQTISRFDLDRDCIVQGAIDRDFDLRVHFAKPLRVQGLK